MIIVMKKIIFIFILLFIANTLPSQVRVNFSLTNPRLDQGKFVFDVVATIPTGQQWKVGPTCIRINFNTVPPNGLSVLEDNPALNANTNLSGNNNYGNMTTTSILNDTAVSLNILQLYQHNCYYMTPGTYTLGSVRWNVLNLSACINTGFLSFSAIFDSMTALTYQTQWTGVGRGCDPIGVTQLSNNTPAEFKLYQNYPNPFNPATTIRFDIPKTSNVRLTIYDALGREVETPVDREIKTGTYEVSWDARNYSSGLYFYKLITDEFVETNKMVLIK
jgi:hypothetical protein